MRFALTKLRLSGRSWRLESTGSTTRSLSTSEPTPWSFPPSRLEGMQKFRMFSEKVCTGNGTQKRTLNFGLPSARCVSGMVTNLLDTREISFTVRVGTNPGGTSSFRLSLRRHGPIWRTQRQNVRAWTQAAMKPETRNPDFKCLRRSEPRFPARAETTCGYPDLTLNPQS